MRQFFQSVSVLFVLLLLSACGGGGGGGGAFNQPAAGLVVDPATTVVTLNVQASAAQLNSDSSDEVTLTAFLTDINGVAVENAEVSFLASSGSVVITQGTSDSAGKAIATLNAGGNSALRSITATVKVGTLTVTTVVTVVDLGAGATVDALVVRLGASQLNLDGSDSLTLTVVPVVAGGVAVQGVLVSFTADNGGVVVVPVDNNGDPATTDTNGEIAVTLSIDTLTTLAGTITVTASAGGVNQTIDIAVVDVGAAAAAAVNTLNVQLSAAQLSADGSDEVKLTAFLTDINGIAIEGAVVSFSPDTGSIVIDQPISDSNGNAIATLTPGGNATPRTITVTVDVGTLVPVQITVDVVDVVVPLTIDSILLQTSSAQLNANGSGTVTLTATAVDANNIAIEGVVVSFAADDTTNDNVIFVAVTQGTTDENGIATATLGVAANASTPRTITVTASASGVNKTVDVAVVNVALSVNTMNLQASTIQIQAGSADTIDLTAILTDSNSVAVEGAVVSFSADSGAVVITQGTSDANGQATATLSTGGDSTVRTILVTATGGGITKTINVGVVATVSGPEVDSIILLSNVPQMGTGGADTVDLIAIVKDSNNNLLEGVDVVFVADSGAVQVTQATSDAAGQALAILSTGGDTMNRSIVVTATAGSQNSAIVVDVAGTGIVVNGESALTFSGNTPLTLTLTDSTAAPIVGEILVITSALGNSVTAVTLVTDAAGQVLATYNADVASGNDSLTITSMDNSLGVATVSAVYTIAVSSDSFQVLTPASATEVDLGANEIVTVRWLSNGIAQAGQTVNFSATRGTLLASTAVTDASGDASINISSTNAGPSLITAYVDNGGPTTSVDIEFIAIAPVRLDLQTDISTVAPNNGNQSGTQQAIITAIVRDINDNLVKNQVVRFELVDISQGSLSNATATTNSVGQASTTFTSGAGATALNGVVINAVAQGLPLVTDTVYLTVTEQALFVRLATGNLMEALSNTLYQKDYEALVTSVAGNPVPNVQVTISAIPTFYDKGYRVWDAAAELWVPVFTIPGATGAKNLSCLSEDIDRNGLLDAGEDINVDAVLTPGNILSVPVTVTTDANGFANIPLIYAKDYAGWVQIELTATVGGVGSESRDRIEFILPILNTDVNVKTSPPPGNPSLFGTGNTCYTGGSLVANLSQITAAGDTDVTLTLRDELGNPIVGTIMTTFIEYSSGNNSLGIWPDLIALTLPATDVSGQATSVVTIPAGLVAGDSATITYVADGPNGSVYATAVITYITP
ncbi:MAG: hypothetical protein GXP22_05145 [Gammaproteobacteria bacterium]|nr:hypothetical protein [Gammaproteobacteria bacterium]